MDESDIDKLPLMERRQLDTANEIAGLLYDFSIEERLKILHWLIQSLKEEMSKIKNEYNKP